MPKTRIPLAVLMCVVTACVSDKAKSNAPAAPTTGGTVVIASAADAEGLFPPLLNDIVGKQVTDLIFDRLADISPDLQVTGDKGFRPQLADKWDWSADSLSIAFHLNPKARWHDGVPVRASDVRFSWQLYVDTAVASPSATLFTNIDSVTVRDSLTPVFWFKRHTPTEFFDAAYQMDVLPEHALSAENRSQFKSSAFTRAPIGSGRFRFVKWVPGERLELVSDTGNYRGRAKLDRVIFAFNPDFSGSLARLYSGEADFLDYLTPQDVAEVAKHPELKAVPYPALDYNFIAFNMRDPKSTTHPHPVLGDLRVRKAIWMALDRATIVKSVLDSLGTVSNAPVPTALAPKGMHIDALKYDVAGAKALLDSAGWVAGANGMRAKGGKPLRFSLTVPTSSKTRSKMAVLIQESLRQVGIQMDIDGVDFNAFSEREQKHAFDAVFGGWHSDPNPANLEETWGGAGAKEGGANFGYYLNTAFDAQADSAAATDNPDVARTHRIKAYQLLVADVPAVFLYEPRLMAAAHKRLVIPPMRADAWWMDIPDWSVAPDQRIARDNIGLAGSADNAATPVKAPDSSSKPR